MSHEIFIEYLKNKCSYKKKIENEQKIYKNYMNPNNNRVAVIIEPRKHELLEAVIRNVMSNLDDSWNLHIWTTKNNKNWLQELFPYWKFYISEVPFINMNQTLYNGYLLDPYFWDKLNEDYVLIFQTDCITFRKFDEEYLNYDYIGANYYRKENVAPNIGGIQGGLSFRNKKAMIYMLSNIAWDDIKIYRAHYNLSQVRNKHEDVFFTHACEILKMKTLESNQRKYFSVENDEIDEINKLPFGHHGFNLPYISKNKALKIISLCEDHAM